MRVICCFAVFFSICLLTSRSFAEEVSPRPKLKIEDLGFKRQSLSENEGLQELRETRSWRLRTHQTMAYVTWGLMGTTVLLAEQAKRNNLHQTLGMLTAGSYFLTAYLSTFAPDPDKISGKSGLNIKIHKILRWVHLPLMVLLPFAGIQADRQNDRGQPHSGLAKYKGAMGGLAFASYTLAGTVMFFEF